MSCKLEPTIWPRATGQRIPCFDRCQLIVVLMSNINEVQSKPRLYVSVNLFWSMAAMLCDSVAAVVVVVVRTRSRARPLAMITVRKSTHGFSFLSHDKYGALLGGPSGRRSSAIMSRTYNILIQESHNSSRLHESAICERGGRGLPRFYTVDGTKAQLYA